MYLGEKTGEKKIVKEIKQYQEKWLQHVQRMDTNRIPKKKEKVYLPSLMIKVPNHLYVLGDTYK
jgi:hypothetical protein